MPDLKTTFDADRTMRTETPAPAVAPYPGLSPDLIALLMAREPTANTGAPMARRPMARRLPDPTYEDVVGRPYEPQFRAAPPRQPSASSQLGNRYSYAFTPKGWAGSAPGLPTYVGKYDPRDKIEDDPQSAAINSTIAMYAAANLGNVGKAGGPGGQSDMERLTAQQQAAKRW